MGKLDKLSKFISLILRHKPEAANIELDEHGWANVEDLIIGINQTGRTINLEILEEIVASDQKQRYSFNADKTLLRANQGHSIPVDVELTEQKPPEFLYHGTAERFLDSIMAEGLKPMSRLYIHLSKDTETAQKEGLFLFPRSNGPGGHVFCMSIWRLPRELHFDEVYTLEIAFLQFFCIMEI